MQEIVVSHQSTSLSPQPKIRGTTIVVVTILAMAIGVLFLTWRWATRGHEIVVVGSGAQSVVYAQDGTVSELLQRLGYRPGMTDRVESNGQDLQNGTRIRIQRAIPVQVTVDGFTSQVFSRQATTISDLLADQGIHLGWRDKLYLDDMPVDPDLTLPPPKWSMEGYQLAPLPWHADATPLRISIVRSVSISIQDGAAPLAFVSTTANTVAEALRAENIPLYVNDFVFPGLETLIQPDMRIVIQRSVPIRIMMRGQILETRTRAATVGSALAEAGLSVFGVDEVQPSLSQTIVPNLEIHVTQVHEEIVYEDEILPFETIWVADDDLPIDQRLVREPGQNGIIRQRNRLRYENGQNVANQLEAKWVVQAPSQRLIAYGRKIEPRTLETPTGMFTYWRKIRMYATSYSPARSGTPKSAPWYGRTRTGMPLSKGIAAVDPAVVNMKQAMYIPEYGQAVAGDIGGGVKGRHIDLGYSDHDYESWHWWTDVYLLWPPPEKYAINYLLPNWPRYPDPDR